MKKRRRKKKAIDPHRWIEEQLNRDLAKWWLYWPYRKQFKDSLQGTDGLYPCIKCGARVERKMLHIDHIHPYVPLDSDEIPKEFWNKLIDKIQRKLCYQTNMQPLCTKCHKSKTKRENEHRRLQRDRKKI